MIIEATFRAEHFSVFQSLYTLTSVLITFSTTKC